MNRLKLLSILLTVAFLVSLSVNAYFGSQILALNKQKNSQATELEMVSILTQVQVQVTAELQKIGGSLVYASEQLSPIGIGGDKARAVLSALAANSSFIIDAATADLNNNLVAVEPSTYRNAEGVNIGEQDYMNTHSRNPIQPSMTDVIPLVEGFNGTAICVPIFNSNGVFIGSVSVIFDPSVLLNATIAPAVAGTPYTMWATQPDGLDVCDADPAQIGLNILSDPVYEQYPQMLSVMRQIVEEPSGHNSYQYLKTLASGQLVSKEAYWATISAFGKAWRLVIVHATNP